MTNHRARAGRDRAKDRVELRIGLSRGLGQIGLSTGLGLRI